MFLLLNIDTPSVAEDTYATCATTVLVREDKSPEEKFWATSGDEGYAYAMSAETADELIQYVYECAQALIPIITFNGTGFHFKHLHKIATNKANVELLALLTRDVFVNFATEFGYFSSMKSISEGCNLPPKTISTVKWDSGDPLDQESIKEASFKASDALRRIVCFYKSNKCLYRLASSGRKSVWTPRGELFRPTFECIKEFEAYPDQQTLKSRSSIEQLWTWIPSFSR